MQLEEGGIRENNLKRMHSSMLSAFSSTNDNESPIKSKSAEEIETLKDNNSFLIEENKKLKNNIEINNNDMISKYE